MYGTIDIYVPTGTSEKAARQRNDLQKIYSDIWGMKSIVTQLKKEKPRKLIKQKIVKTPHSLVSYTQERMAPIMDTMISPTAIGDPLWYPPVTEYTAPVENVRSIYEISQIKYQKLSLPHMDFVSDNTYILNTPLMPEDIESGASYIRSTETIVHTISVYSSPSGKLIKQVGYAIYLLVPPSPSPIELLGISVLKRPWTLQSAIQHLSRMRVSNWRDLRMTSIHLSDVYHSITRYSC